MVAGRPGAGRQKEGALFFCSGRSRCRVGVPLTFQPSISPFAEARARKEVFRFLRSSRRRCFGVTGTAAAACPPARSARGNERRAPPPLYRPNILPFSPGKHGRGKSAGNKTQPCGTRRESKAPAGRASSADQRPIPASGQGKSLSGDTHACTKKPGPIGNRKCALSGAVFGRGRLRASLFTARQYGGLQCSLNASFVFF